MFKFLSFHGLSLPLFGAHSFVVAQILASVIIPQFTGFLEIIECEFTLTGLNVRKATIKDFKS